MQKAAKISCLAGLVLPSLGLAPVLAGDGVPVTAITTQRTAAPVSGPYTNNGKTVFYGNGDNVKMMSATVGSLVLSRSSISQPVITINRIDNPNSSGERMTMFYPGYSIGNDVYIEGEEALDMEQAINDEYITSGGLDVFLNVAAGLEHPNNIERIDFVDAAGIDLPTTPALLLEIGTVANEKHGNNTYKIAMITSLDAFGEPDGYGPLATVQGNVDYGNLGRPVDGSGVFMHNNYIRNAAHPSGGTNGIVGYEGLDANFIGMSFVSFDAMGATPGQTVYGYSLFASDMFDSNDLVGLTDAPLNTATGTNGGDIYGGTFAVFATPAAELKTGSGGVPNLFATKTVSVFDPLSEGLYAVPGNDVVYSISLNNSGNASPDAGSMFFTDLLPSEIEFYNGDIDDAGPETDPIAFLDSGSGLSFIYGTDSGYSNSATAPADMTDCNYAPMAGYDPNVTYVCFAPSGTMNNGAGSPGFILQFRGRIK